MTPQDSSPQTARISAALDLDIPSLQIEPLVTLPHSFVARISHPDLGDGAALIFKQAGSPDFASGLRKELVVNRDVLSQFPKPVGPAFVSGDENAELPWILFDDVAVDHSPASTQPPPHSQIEQFIVALATTHAQARALPLVDLFKDVEGDVRVTDGAEYIPDVLDAFLRDVAEDRFPARCRELVASVRDNIPLVAQLLSDDETLVHGDAHFGNALYDNSGALLIDWALAVMGPGEADLTHALAMNLPRLLSEAHEESLLRTYADTCNELGHATSLDGVRERYRRCLLVTLIVAVGMRTVPGMADQVWSYMFTNAMHSALDHDVIELIR